MKSNAAPQTITAGQVPPYCFRLPGMSAEAGALAAAKALRMTIPCDALALLWELRHVAAKVEAENQSASDALQLDIYTVFETLPHALPQMEEGKPCR